jgi:hypothetical protein
MLRLSKGLLTNDDGTPSRNRPTYSVGIPIEAILDNRPHEDAESVASGTARADLVPEL